MDESGSHGSAGGWVQGPGPADGGESQERVPPHLRTYVVEQAYDAYTVADQAIWRFILLQTYERLKRTAHPAYAQGLQQTGMSVDRIPRIEEMDRCLAEFGWGAVCVDGFIPPRAFQEFQALGLLPIAADIRTLDHLTYTPAPDIVHEAAGHAPILPDPVYADFLRRFGQIGQRAFSLPHDAKVYDAIYRLSVVKERPDASPAEVAAAEQQLQSSLDAVQGQSEAGRLARLYWWTVEYGLVGTPADYKLYGAGLLSSLGESHFCHDGSVAKLPLSLDCMEVGYDITRSQPQLFVCEDFEHLGGVLQAAADTLASRRGGLAALEVARQSTELATVELETGAQVLGQVVEVGHLEQEPNWVALAGPAALALDGCLLPEHGPAAHQAGYAFPLGPLSDGAQLAHLDPAELRRRYGERDGSLVLDFSSGIRVRGLLQEVSVSTRQSQPAFLVLRNCRITRGSEPLLEAAQYVLPVGTQVRRVMAGAIDPAFFPPTVAAGRRVPQPREVDPAMGALLELYRRAETSFRTGHADAAFAEVYARMQAEHPNEWLLRWNLLESLRKLGVGGGLDAALVSDLRRLEGAYGGKQPIASGLRYLGIEP